MDKVNNVNQSKIIELSESEDGLYLFLTGQMCYLDEYNLNGIRLMNSDSIEKHISTLIDTPVVAKYTWDENNGEDFSGHEMYRDWETGNILFDTQAIGTHQKVWIENRIVKPVFSEFEKELPVIMYTAKIWSDRFPRFSKVIKKLYEANNLGTSWELIPNSITSEKSSIDAIPNPRSTDDFTLIGNCLLGKDVMGAYEGTSKVTNISSVDNSQYSIAEALKQDMIELSLKKEDFGTGEMIKVEKSVESAKNTSWGSVDKTSLRNTILKASNYKTLVNSVYLEVNEGWEDAPSSMLSYPVMQISSGVAVYNINAIQSALSFLQNSRTESNPTVFEKLRKLYKKFGLETDVFNSKTIERSKSMEERTLEELKTALAEAENKLKTYEDANKDTQISELQESIDSLKIEKSGLEEKLIKATDSLTALTSQVEELKPFKVEFEKIETEKAEVEKQAKIVELTEMVIKGGFVTKEELETSEVLKEMIENCNEDGLKVFRADRIISSLDVEKQKENVDVSTGKVRKEFSEETKMGTDIMTSWLSKK